MNPIAQRIRDARLNAQMTEKELAKKCGLSANYIIAIESGRKIVNEDAASAIFALFGESAEIRFSTRRDPADEKPAQPEPIPTVSPRPVVAQSAEPVLRERGAQWAGALVNLIQEFPIHELRSNKRVGSKELPTLTKNNEEVPREKLLLFRVSDDDAAALRIRKDDILWVEAGTAVQKEGVYLVDWQNRKQIVHIKKDDGRLLLSRGTSDRKSVSVDLKDVRMIGRCVKVEFAL